MLAGTAGLEEGREAHLLDCMIILDEVWNDLDVATIARRWAHAKINQYIAVFSISQNVQKVHATAIY